MQSTETLTQRLEAIEARVQKTTAARKELGDLKDVLDALDGTLGTKAVRVGGLVLPDELAELTRRDLRDRVVARVTKLVTELEGLLPAQNRSLRAKKKRHAKRNWSCMTPNSHNVSR